MKKTQKKLKFDLLRDITLTRWQVGLFKMCVLSCGILFTIYLYNFFSSLERLRWVLAIIPGIYLVYVYFSPTKRSNFLKR